MYCLDLAFKVIVNVPLKYIEVSFTFTFSLFKAAGIILPLTCQVVTPVSLFNVPLSASAHCIACSSANLSIVFSLPPPGS